MLMFFLPALGFIGLLGMTWLFPLLGWLISLRRSPRRYGETHPKGDVSVQSIAVLIPANNEGLVLSQTLASILGAIAEVKKMWPGTIRLCVGADGCADDTVKIAMDHGVEVIELKRQQGKWLTLNTLVHQCKDSQWVVLADAGVIWPKTFLSNLLPYCGKNNVISIAPSYRNPAGGLLEKCVWWVERQLKTLESYSGGPISVHGATVCYRREELLAALKFLDGRNWLNDDVVIPLVLRSLFPDKRILYLAQGEVCELVRTDANRTEFNRRRRMMLGNIEWIKQLWVPIWGQNYTAALLASRRIFRVFWAYWLVFVVAAAVFVLGAQVWPQGSLGWALLAIAAVSFLNLYSAYTRQCRSFLESAYASLIAPYYLFTASLSVPRCSEVVKWT